MNMNESTPHTESPTNTSSKFARALHNAVDRANDGWSAAGVGLRNGIKRMRNVRLDYIVLPVGGSLPERSGPPRGFIERRLPLPPDPQSIQQLNVQLQRVADAQNVRGVVFILREFDAGLATLQNLRTAILRLRAAGKEAIVYTPYLDMAHYYVATAADLIVVPPSSRFEVLGLYTETTFLKDSLERVGLSAEVVQISPYKTAFDRFSRSEMSPEHRRQLNWLLDDQFDMITTGMATGRNLSQAELKVLIDQAPLTPDKALEKGLIDHIAYDDELAGRLGSRMAKDSIPPSPTQQPSAKTDRAGERKAPQAIIKTWPEARKLLMEKPHRRGRKHIGIVSLEGLISMGASRKPPIDLPIPFIGGAVAGEQTIVGALRQLEKRKDLAALVFHVDSGGGSALASDLIGRQIELIAAKIPVVVYMGNVAASGGYYISAPARFIMSQEATLTGSIGVIVARISTSGLLDQLSVNRESMVRGEHAGLFRGSEPWTETERDLFRQSVDDTYEQFRKVVVKGRQISSEQVDEVGLGRVWTGRQARERQLVDGHGDFLDAIKKAAELAALPIDDIYAIPALNYFARTSSYVSPVPGSTQVIQTLSHLLSGQELKELTGQPLMLLPYDLRFR